MIYKTSIVSNGFGDWKYVEFLGYYSDRKEAESVILKHRWRHLEDESSMYRTATISEGVEIIDFGSYSVFGRIEEVIDDGQNFPIDYRLHILEHSMSDEELHPNTFTVQINQDGEEKIKVLYSEDVWGWNSVIDILSYMVWYKDSRFPEVENYFITIFEHDTLKEYLFLP